MTQRKETYLRIISILLVLTTIISFAGCRPSSVLQQIVYTDNAQTDKNNQMNNNSQENKDKDENLPKRNQDNDSNTKRDYNYSGAVKGDNNSSKVADDEVFGETENKGSAAGTAGGSSSTTVTNSNNTGATDQDEILPTSDNRQLRQVVDATGVSVTIPKDVNTVTAVGDLALYVEMLGGKNRLIATSSNFKTNRFATAVFGSSEINSMKSLWPGDGVTTISDAEFKTLVALKPDVCLIISGQTTFSNAQLAELKKRLIYVVTVPKLNNTTNVKKAVNIVAEVLGDKSSETGKKNAHSVANAYISWYDSIISDVKSKGKSFSGTSQVNYDYDRYANYREITDSSLSMSGYYSLFISDWDTGASYQVKNNTYFEFSGTGMAIAPSGYSTTTMSYNMSIGGVANAAALTSDHYQLKNWYISPLVPSTRSVVVSKNAGVWESSSNNGLTNAEGNYLGTEKYKNVIVASNNVKTGILNDQLWKNYGYQTGATSGFGRLDSNGTLMLSNIQGDYGILINPSGVGRWYTSSPESPLESVWINSMYFGDYSIVDLKSKISNFYQQFYGYTPNDDMLSSIIAGE